jgi:transcriptional regulator with XRE-family HTH domain
MTASPGWTARSPVSVAEPGITVTVEEARRCIGERIGFRQDAREGCWIWKHPASTGYGPFLSFYKAAYGEFDPGKLEVVHICSGGAKGCVRPRHLDLVPIGSRIARVPDRALALEERSGFAAQIRDERRARKATKADFGRELGVSASTITSWEAGRTAPDPDHYDEIKQRLGWDGLLRRFEVIVVVERIRLARSSGEAARAVIDELTPEGEPDKVEIVRCRVRA